MYLFKTSAGCQMIELIHEYEQGKIGFQWLVYKMAKLLETGEMAKEKARQYYGLWEEMKVIALGGMFESGFDHSKIDDCLAKMRLLLS